jgi:hypothetical protein
MERVKLVLLVCSILVQSMHLMHDTALLSGVARMFTAL